MKKRFFVALMFFAPLLAFAKESDDFVKVEGGKITVIAGENDFHPKGTKRVLKVNDFYISKIEVTQELYKRITQKNPLKKYRPEHPVENVSGYEVIEFCNALSKKENLEPCYIYQNKKWICDFSKNGYRVPTLDEWEFAARGGNKSKNYLYSGSNSSEEVAWFDSNSFNSSHKVATLKPNELGLFDMSGNVGEWNWDEAYKGECSVHIGRGGCWIFDEWFCHTSYRFITNENYHNEGLGFRLVRSNLEEPESM